MAIDEIQCPHCHGTGTSPTSGETCHVCGGDGDVAPKGLHKITEAHAVEIHTRLEELITTVGDLADVVNDIKDKCDDIFEKINE